MYITNTVMKNYIMCKLMQIFFIKIKILKGIFATEPKAMNSYLTTHTRAANSLAVAL